LDSRPKGSPLPLVSCLFGFSGLSGFFDSPGAFANPANKTNQIDQINEQQFGEFRLTDIEQACPGVGREWIRSLLTDLKAAGDATCQGRGPAARWRYLGSKGSNSIEA
jgi:hypothetical protein